jgi:hypothetical protein
VCSGPATIQALPDGPIIQWISSQGNLDILWAGPGPGFGVVLRWEHSEQASSLQIEDAGMPGTLVDEFQQGSQPGNGPVWWQTFDLGGETLVYGFATREAKSIEIHAGGQVVEPQDISYSDHPIRAFWATTSSPPNLVTVPIGQ